MNQEQIQSKMAPIRDQLKMTLRVIEANKTITPSTITTLWQMTGKAHSEMTALKSEVCGNEPPKIG